MKPTKLNRTVLVFAFLTSLLVFNSQFSTAHAQGTAFTYQGRLNSGTNPATGIYDLRFTIYDAVSGGSVAGSALTNAATPVTNGLFTVMLDFGSGVFNGNARWLDIAVRTNGATSFTTLLPRQKLTPTPYAVMANTASNLLGTLPATQLGGTVANSQLANNSITVTAGAGLGGGGTVALGGATTLNNAGVLSVTGNPDITASTVNGAVTLGDTATNANLANTIVKRDVGGNFSAGSIILSTNLYLPAATASAGIIYSGSTPFVYASGSGAMSFFAGFGAGNLTMSGNYNTGVGYGALHTDTTGANNTAYGLGALGVNTTGYENIASGVNTMANNVSGGQNAVYGTAALYSNTNGTANTANGYETLFLNTSGSNNTAGGYKALYNNKTGNANIALGYQAGYNLTIGSSNIDIGNLGLAADTNIIRIGSGQTQTFIAGTVNANGAGLTNLNPAGFSGLLAGSSIDDGGDAAYEQFLGPAKSLSAADPLPFSDLSLVSSNSEATPSFTFLLDGAAFGTVAGFVGHEAISEPYEYVVEVIASSSTLVLNDQLGLAGALTFARNGRSTTFAGIITGCSVSSYDGTSVLYTFRIESRLAYLALWTDYHIYQNTSVPNLVSTLFNYRGYTPPSQSLTGTHSSRDSAIQFGETELNFFSRLLEDEGIFYFFGLSGSPPTLILGDYTGAYLSAPNSPFSYYGDTATNAPLAAEYIQTFQKAKRESVKTSTIRVCDFTAVAGTWQGTSSATEGHWGELYQFGSSAKTLSGLNAQAPLRVQRQTVERNTTFGTGNAPDLRPGCTFTLTDQTGAGLDGSYLVTAIRHGAFRRLTNGVASLYYGNEFEVILASTVYRPALKTPRPTAQPCTAVVTGPAGEEIYTDKYGRVKVQFYWDRYGSSDENSSAWLRVASQWAGDQWGMIFLPRIGQEVMVDFVQGDPDQPVITGSFYNETHRPPYELPDNQTVSTIKTRSSKGGTAANYNEIRFEDKKGSEALDITAEKDMTISVGNNLTNSASHDLTISAGHNMSIVSGQGIGINTFNDPAYALNVNGTVKAAAFQGDGSGLSSLPTNVAYLNLNQTFSAQTAFAGPVTMNNLVQVGGTLSAINTIYADAGAQNTGSLIPGLIFGGPVSSEGISSKRTAGTDQYGLDFYTANTIRMNVNNNGNVGIGTTSPSTPLEVKGTVTAYNYIANVAILATNAIIADAGALNNGTLYPGGLVLGGLSSSEGICSKRTAGINQYGLSLITSNALRMAVAYNGNVGIANSNPTNLFMVQNARCDGSSWINSSDRNLKQDFAPVNAQAVLEQVAALPVQTWSYKAQPDQKHLGPVAQDFHAAFGLGADDVSIATVDEGGVALAAIQGLNQKLNEKDAEIQGLKQSVAELKETLTHLTQQSK
jgi:type VI secretion system secreted protein VgrG